MSAAEPLLSWSVDLAIFSFFHILRHWDCDVGNFQATPWSVYASQTIPEHICSVNSPGGSWNTVNAFAWSAGVSTKVTCINVTIHKIVRSWYSLECHTASGGLPFFHSVPCCYQVKEVHAPNRQQDSQSCLCAYVHIVPETWDRMATALNHSVSCACPFPSLLTRLLQELSA